MNTAEIIRDLTPSKLVALHNAIIDSINPHVIEMEVPNHVNRFSDRASGLKRVGNLIQALWEKHWMVEVDGSGVFMRLVSLQEVEETLPPEPATAAPAEASPSSSAPVEPSSAAPAAKRRGAAPDYEDHLVITVVAAENPKRRKSASFARFAMYRSGMTVGEYVAAVGNRRLALADIHWDARHGHVSVGEG